MKTKWMSQGGFFAAACAMILGVTLFCAPQARGDSKKDAEGRAKAEAMIQKAIALSDLRAPGSQPFMLAGEINIRQPDGSVAHGTYLLKWAAPDKWREETKLDNFQSTWFGGENETFEAQPVDYDSLGVYQLNAGLTFVSFMRATVEGSQWKGSDDFKFKSQKVGGREANCVSFRLGPQTKFNFCFDAQQGALVREEHTAGAVGIDAIEFSDFSSEGAKLFPGLIRFLKGKNTVLEFRVAKLGGLQGVSDSEFVPPKDARRFPACNGKDAIAPKLLQMVKPAYPSMAKEAYSQGPVIAFAVIGTDGLLHHIQLVSSPGISFVRPALDALQYWRYSPLTCGGQPMNTDITVEVNFALGGRDR
jgi:Gram-negative bacterial TonB protein C-terminal